MFETKMKRIIISTPRAPAAIGPYSQGVQAGGFLFISGQISLHPETGELIQGDVRKQTARVMENLKAILSEAGASFNSVVKCTIYLKDMGDFAGVNEVYGSYFEAAPPSRATVEVSALPKGVAVEIDAVAYLG